MRTISTPIALTIAGSDSGGGAGIQADLKVFAALGVHGTSAITCITAQNPRRVCSIEAVSSGMVRDQLTAVFEELPPRAVKIGMLYSAEIVRTVARFFSDLGRKSPVLIVDPLIVSSSGTNLLDDVAFEVLKNELLPLADLITPNLDETARFLERKIEDIEQMREAALELHRRFGLAVLVKGGHLKTGEEAADIFYDGKEELLLSAPFVRGLRTHGTGCTYSAAIAGYRALGNSMAESIIAAKTFITNSIAQNSRTSKRHDLLNPFWKKS